MNNKKVCEYINTLDANKKYLAEEFVKSGLGQTTGGYLGNVRAEDIPNTETSQKQHFLNYYGNENISDKKPTFSYLRCPQLILFIAEVFGVPDKALNAAYDIIQDYEQKGKIINTTKNGNYLWGKEVFREFKNALKIGEVNKIIRDNDNIGDIKKEVEKLFK